MASCTMVNSRCVAGLSIGIRPFSAIAIIISETSAIASDTRKPTTDVCMNVEIAERSVERATRETVKTTVMKAGSAREAIMTSRLEPMPPKDVPTSMPPRAKKKRPVASKPTMAIKSADHVNNKPLANVDHLDGILFIDRISRLKRGLYLRRLKKQAAGR